MVSHRPLTVEELTTEFKTNAAYAPLIVGSKAGGNGTNNAGGGAEGKVITRSQFDGMGVGEKRSYLKDGGTLNRRGLIRNFLTFREYLTWQRIL